MTLRHSQPRRETSVVLRGFFTSSPCLTVYNSDMSRIFKPTYTRRFPLSKVFDAEGKPFVAVKKARVPVTIRDGAAYALLESQVYAAEYRVADRTVVKSTGRRKASEALRVLAQFEAAEARVASGLLSREEASTVSEAARPLAEHLADYFADMEARRLSANYRRETERHLRRAVAELNASRLADLSRAKVEAWLRRLLAIQQRADAPPVLAAIRTRNAYRDDLATFVEWCRVAGRCATNPLADLPKPSAKSDRKRPRRALTRPEFARLCAAATPERAELYRVLLLTGLRVNELRTLTVGRLDLDATPPVIGLDAKIDKSRRGDEVVVAAELVPILRRHAAGKRQGDRLLVVPGSFLARLNGDLRRAGIPKVDGRGRTVDLHGMRRTLATWLAADGVAPKIAQRILRHRDLRMTLDVYTDPDVAASAAALDLLVANLAVVGDSEGDSVRRGEATDAQKKSENP